MNIVRFDPWRELDAFFGARPQRSVAARWVPQASISESPSAYRIELELPAVDTDDVEVSVKDRVLTVSGQRRAEAEGDWQILKSERVTGEFSRSFRLPKDAREDAIEASSAGGVLTVLIRKVEEAGPRRIEIEAA